MKISICPKIYSDLIFFNQYVAKYHMCFSSFHGLFVTQWCPSLHILEMLFTNINLHNSITRIYEYFSHNWVSYNTLRHPSQETNFVVSQLVCWNTCLNANVKAFTPLVSIQGMTGYSIYYTFSIQSNKKAYSIEWTHLRLIYPHNCMNVVDIPFFITLYH